MRSKFMAIGVAVLAIVALSACSALAPAQSTLAAGEAAPALGGGTVLTTNGQTMAGVVVVGSGQASAEPEIAEVIFGDRSMFCMADIASCSFAGSCIDSRSRPRAASSTPE